MIKKISELKSCPFRTPHKEFGTVLVKCLADECELFVTEEVGKNGRAVSGRCAFAPHVCTGEAQSALVNTPADSKEDPKTDSKTSK